MIITIRVLPGEDIPSNFAQWILGCGPGYEKRHKGEFVPKITLMLERDDKQWLLEGGFWMEMQKP